MRRALARLLLLALPLGAAAGEIPVAQVLPLTGAVARDAEAVALGVRVGIAATNARGGIRGDTVRLKVYDDTYKPDRTAELAAQAAREGAVALLMPVGSASIVHLLRQKTLEELQLPVVGAVPGSDVLRRPGSPWLFHIRAGDERQVAKLVEHAWTVGQRRFAVLYGDIPFGPAGVAAAREWLAARQAKPAVAIGFDMAKHEEKLAKAGELLRAENAESVLVIGGASQSGKVFKLLREQGVFSPVYALSYADVATVCQIAAPKLARGLGVAQIAPNHASGSLRAALDFQRDWKAHAPEKAEPSQYAFEGYLAWRVLAEALTRLREAPTRASVKRALEQLGTLDLGGFRVAFNATQREGSDFVDIGVVDDQCRLKY